MGLNVIRFTPRPRVSPALAIAAPIVAVGSALALSVLALALSGAPLLRAGGVAAGGIIGSPAALGETLARAVPLTLTGLTTWLALRINLYNLGAEGQFLAGSLAALAVGAGVVVAPPAMMVLLVLIAAAAAGAALMLLPALIRLRRGGDEALVTLLLNVVLLFALQMALTGPLDIAAATVRSQPLIEEATLSAAGMQLALGVLLALAAVGLLTVMLRYTVWGFDIRAMSANPAAARSAGIRVTRTMLLVALLSGALAGLAGGIEVIGKGYLTKDVVGLGYAGIAVALLAGRSPLAVVPAALLVSVLLVGAGSLRTIGVSKFLADFAIALTIVLTLIASLLTRYRIHWGLPSRAPR
jgi:simple sugar transport system permease protein